VILGTDLLLQYDNL